MGGHCWHLCDWVNTRGQEPFSICCWCGLRDHELVPQAPSEPHGEFLPLPSLPKVWLDRTETVCAKRPGGK